MVTRISSIENIRSAYKVPDQTDDVPRRVVLAQEPPVDALKHLLVDFAKDVTLHATEVRHGQLVDDIDSNSLRHLIPTEGRTPKEERAVVMFGR